MKILSVNNKMGTQSPLHSKEKTSWALAPQHQDIAPYSKIRLHRRAVYSMKSPIKLGALNRRLRKSCS